MGLRENAPTKKNGSYYVHDHVPSFSSLNSLRYMQTTVVRAHFQTPKSSKPAPSRRAHLNFHLRPSWFLGLAGRGLNGDLMVIYELQCFSIRKIMENWSVELCLTASCRRVQHFSIFLVADEPNGWHMMLMAKWRNCPKNRALIIDAKAPNWRLECTRLGCPAVPALGCWPRW